METRTGIIIRIIARKHYGFIKPDDGEKELFFHQRGLINPVNFDDLREGAPVAFLVVDDKKGPRAIGVVVS